MKHEVITLCHFGNYNSYGEYFRALHRTNALMIMNGPAFKLWLKLKEQDKEHQIEDLKHKAKELGYEVQKINQRQLVTA